jgi:hypothetical protein
MDQLDDPVPGRRSGKGVGMMRKIWIFFVPGDPFCAALWGVSAIWNVSAAWRPELSVIYGAIALLNAYSWDYQRRHGNGGA